MRKQIVHIDSDGCVTNIIENWVNVYNKKYGDNLPVSAFAGGPEVDLETIVKPECGSKIYDFLSEPGFFEQLTPLPGAVEAMKRLCNNPALDCYVLTNYSGDAEPAKGKVLYFKKHFPFLDPDRIILCKPKHLVFGHILIDDSVKNLYEWSAFQSGNDLHDHHTILIDSAGTYMENNRVDATVSCIADAVTYIENILL
jgi:5'-nucleotidase